MKLYVMAEHREAYARWCGGRGVKQNHAVFVSGADRIEGRAIAPDQFIFVDGWQKSSKHSEIMAGYGLATLKHLTEAK